MPNSQNGWPASGDPNAIGITTVTLSGGKSFQAASAVAPNLKAMAEWWHDNIEPITMIGGYNFREIRGYEGTGKYSNHASGTAIDINWNKFTPSVNEAQSPRLRLTRSARKLPSLGSGGAEITGVGQTRCISRSSCLRVNSRQSTTASARPRSSASALQHSV